jgi:hypothetical protein
MARGFFQKEISIEKKIRLFNKQSKTAGSKVHGSRLSDEGWIYEKLDLLQFSW